MVSTPSSIDIKKAAKDILNTIEREREREIISRRFGLYDRRETLEQIGERLGITRERVRQLEKAIISRLKTQAEKDLPHINQVEREFTRILHEMGQAARVKAVAGEISDTEDTTVAHVSFLSTLAPSIQVLDENDDYYLSIGIADKFTDPSFKEQIDNIVKLIKEHGQPLTVDELYKKTNYGHPSHVNALATLSKKLATLEGVWGLVKWPTVNPKNIRDKIYVVLQASGNPMHFTEISETIKESDFKRKDVTTQAIHNELIKDKRFVLIGRGIYALKEWGYKKGTVADTIADILKKEGKPLHRDEIVKRVLKHRQVKETTILLNLQGKPQFKRVAKATYELAQV
jgi:DNA-directed RNA polymerase delta subunit